MSVLDMVQEAAVLVVCLAVGIAALAYVASSWGQ